MRGHPTYETASHTPGTDHSVSYDNDWFYWSCVRLRNGSGDRRSHCFDRAAGTEFLYEEPGPRGDCTKAPTSGQRSLAYPGTVFIAARGCGDARKTDRSITGAAG